MIFNNSSIKFNVTFQGREYGFAPFETKPLKNLTEEEEKKLVKRYKFLVFVPNRKKEEKKKEEKELKLGMSTTSLLSNLIENEVKQVKVIQPVAPRDVEVGINMETSPCAEYLSNKETIVLAQKESVKFREDDIADVIDKKETISLDKPVNKREIFELDGIDTDNENEHDDIISSEDIKDDEETKPEVEEKSSTVVESNKTKKSNKKKK